MRSLFLSLLIVALAAPAGAAPLPETSFELGDVPENIREEAERIWAERAPEVQDKLWPYARAPRPVAVRLMDSAAYAEWTEGWMGDWTVGAAGADWIALDVQRLRAVGQTLEHVLIHEYAHCLIRQGAGERADVPRWFHEGVAQHVAREWRLGDSVSLVVAGGVPDLRTLDQGLGGSVSVDAFYRASLLAARRLEDAYGPTIFRDLILAQRTYGGFSAAFLNVTGDGYGEFAAEFSASVRLRYGWLFLITRWPTLFVLAALVFLLGAILKRRRDRRRLEEMPEDAPEPASLPEPEPEPEPRRLWPAAEDPPDGRPH